MKSNRKSVGYQNKRFILIDCIRGLGVLLMIFFHFIFDLGFFGLAGITFLGHPYWLAFAKFIVSLFLVCAGIGLALVHKSRIRWDHLRKRFLLIGAWALVITIVTYVLIPGNFIFFGVLHCIAAGSVIGVFFVKRPRLSLFFSLLILGSGILWQPTLIPIKDWLGVEPVDYIPLYPYFGVVLLGIFLESIGFHQIPLKGNLLTKPLEFMGKHSLKIYLIHQPVFIVVLFAIFRLNIFS